MATKDGVKTGGRTKGVPNKKTDDLIAKCKEMNIDVFEELLKYIIGPCEMNLRFQAIKEAAQYIYPKRKSIEHSGNIGPYDDKSLEELEALVLEKLKGAKKK